MCGGVGYRQGNIYILPQPQGNIYIFRVTRAITIRALGLRPCPLIVIALVYSKTHTALGGVVYLIHTLLHFYINFCTNYALSQCLISGWPTMALSPSNAGATVWCVSYKSMSGY